jgi:hypothetical protein
MKEPFVLDLAIRALNVRVELFNRIPSVTNMILAFNVAEAIILNEYKLSHIEIDEKLLIRYEKLKNLALRNSNFHERKLAFSKSVELFKKLTSIKLGDKDDS